MAELVEKEGKEYVEIENVKSERSTDLAVCCLIDGESVWIPRSQIHDDSEVYDGHQEGTLLITKWIAEQKGLYDS